MRGAVFDSLAACRSVQRRVTTCGPAARALGPDPRDRWCKSSHVDQSSGCSSGGERIVRDDEAAGANPVTQTADPRTLGSFPPFAQESSAWPITGRWRCDSSKGDSWWPSPKSSRSEAVTLVLVGASPIGHPNAAVDQRQSQWFERPCSGGSNPLGGTSICSCGESVSFSTRSHTPGYAGAIPASASSSVPVRSRRCRPTGRVCGFKSHVVRVRIPPAARAFVSCFRRRRPTEESVVSEAT